MRGWMPSVVLFIAFLGVVLYFSLAHSGDNDLKDGVAAYGRLDFRTAFKLLKPLADQGNPEAQFYIADMYQFGQGVKSDLPEAVALYRKSAEQGFVEAEVKLGAMYKSGAGVKQDDAEADKWFHKAWKPTQATAPAEQQSRSSGKDGAQHKAGADDVNAAFLRGDYQTAMKLSRAAADQGNAAAMGNIGRLYENGQGVTQDYMEAAKWLRKAAERGVASAQNDLGFLYDNGQGVSVDHAEAFAWYSKAAEQGYGVAEGNLGVCYENGQGVPQDSVKAYMWLSLAAANDVEGAAKAAQNLTVHMTPEQISEAQGLVAAWKPTKEPAEQQNSDAKPEDDEPQSPTPYTVPAGSPADATRSSSEKKEAAGSPMEGLPLCDSDAAEQDVKKTFADSAAAPILNVKLLELDNPFEVYVDESKGMRACVGTAMLNTGEKAIYYKFSASKKDPSRHFISIEQLDFDLGADNVPDKNLSPQDLEAVKGSWHLIHNRADLTLDVGDKYAVVHYRSDDEMPPDTFRILRVKPVLKLGFRHSDGKFDSSCGEKIGTQDVDKSAGRYNYHETRLYTYTHCPALEISSYSYVGATLINLRNGETLVFEKAGTVHPQADDSAEKSNSNSNSSVPDGEREMCMEKKMADPSYVCDVTGR